MTNEIAKKEDTKPDLIKMELDEIKETYSNPDYFDNENNLLNEFNNLCKETKPTSDQIERKTEVRKEISRFFGLENGLWVSNLGYKRDSSALARMRQKIKREYDCKTSLELMLADSIVACYWRIMNNEMKINRLIDNEDYSYSFDQIKINVMKELSKEVDLANRRLNMNIILLKEMKQPALKVNIKTNNAFIGDKQQFNNNAESNEAK